MSAYMVDEGTIHVLVNAALEWSNPRRGTLRWTDDHIGTRNQETEGPNAWWSEHVRSLNLYGQPNDQTPEQVGNMLLAENRRSVDFRYDEDGVSPEDVYTFRKIAPANHHPWDEAMVLATIQLYTYQACEHPDYWRSEAAQFIDALKERICARIRDDADRGDDRWVEDNASTTRTLLG